MASNPHIILAVILVWFIYRFAQKDKKTTTAEIIPQSENLADILIMMNRRLVDIQKEKASRTKIRYGQWDKAMPALSDKMGAIKLKDWPKFMKDVKRRVKRAAPKPKFRQKFSFKEWARYRERVEFAALSVASQIKDELLQSKEWTLVDGVKVGEWLDGYHWGVKELRDNDPQWKALFESISRYLRNKQLRGLIDKHIDFSYTYNSVCLGIYYSGRFPKSPFSLMLHETLVGSPISPVKAEIALGEILGDIDKRIEEIQKAEQSLVLSIRSWAIGLTGMTGYPKEPGNAAWLLLEVSVNAIDKPIDTLDIIIGGKTIPANHWLSRKVTAFNTYFNVSEWQYKGKNQIELIAYVGGKMHSSGRITIDFDVEVWGKHLI